MDNGADGDNEKENIPSQYCKYTPHSSFSEPIPTIKTTPQHEPLPFLMGILLKERRLGIRR
jgi:hypothetical protein